ncbi:MAG: BCCT transporter [Robiginitomaculum sp.]|nr:MAG: BCCT transporter [Robiginitomaculum sp.]
MKNTRPIVLFLPMAIFILAAVASLIDVQGFLAFAKSLNNWILDNFGTLIYLAVFGFVLTCFAVLFSPIGKVKIGGHDAEPILTRWQWFSITLCTTIAIGILFWAMAEPIYHLYQPGGRDILPGSPGASQFSLVSLFMHWSLSPYAIYTVAGLAFALSFHNFGKPFSVSGPLSILFGRDLPKLVSSLLDAAILLALVLGMAGSLGAGMLLLSGGVANLTPLSSGPFLLALVAGAIGIVVLISSISGLLKGIRFLSGINTVFFFAFVAFIFIFGPTQKILLQGGGAFLDYTASFIPRSLFIGEAASDKEWARDWTIFYYANWLAWAPVTAMFLGRIAVGYTVRAFVLVNLFLPALFSIIWMSVFGVFAMETDMANEGILKQALDITGPESVTFVALEALPFSQLVIPLLLLLSFVSYVTAADSNTTAISDICQKLESGEKSAILSRNLKIIWIGLLAFMAWVMVAFSGIDGVRMLSNVGGLPALFIVIGLQLALLRMAFSSKILRSLQNKILK